jgi:hypothetical protein
VDINHLLRGEQVALLRAQFAPCPDTRRSQLHTASSFADRLRASRYPWRSRAGPAVQ